VVWSACSSSLGLVESDIMMELSRLPGRPQAAAGALFSDVCRHLSRWLGGIEDATRKILVFLGRGRCSSVTFWVRIGDCRSESWGPERLLPRVVRCWHSSGSNLRGGGQLVRTLLNCLVILRSVPLMLRRASLSRYVLALLMYRYYYRICQQGKEMVRDGRLR